MNIPMNVSLFPRTVRNGGGERIVDLCLRLGRPVAGTEQTAVCVDSVKKCSRREVLAKAVAESTDVEGMVIHLDRHVEGAARMCDSLFDSASRTPSPYLA